MQDAFGFAIPTELPVKIGKVDRRWRVLRTQLRAALYSASASAAKLRRA